MNARYSARTSARYSARYSARHSGADGDARGRGKRVEGRGRQIGISLLLASSSNVQSVSRGSRGIGFGGDAA